MIHFWQLRKCKKELHGCQINYKMFSRLAFWYRWNRLKRKPNRTSFMKKRRGGNGMAAGWALTLRYSLCQYLICLFISCLLTHSLYLSLLWFFLSLLFKRSLAICELRRHLGYVYFECQSGGKPEWIDYIYNALNWLYE